MNFFKYKRDVTGNFFPIIDLSLKYKDARTYTSALIDSGATISIFREEVADELNLDIAKGKKMYLQGIGGRIEGFIHELTFAIGQTKLVAPIVFSYEYSVSVNLLGRQGIFKHFKIIFEEKNLQVKLE